MVIQYIWKQILIDMLSKKVDGDYYRHECNRCNYVWYSTVADPKTCASKTCKSPYWNKKRVY
jgi:hypothetical protein